MPRIARENLETSFFHIIVQGVNKEYIFYKQEYIESYFSLMKKYKNEFEVEILAYCIMNNHAHILIFAEKINELAGYMHKINSIYAQHYNKKENRVGHVFRDRYVSEGIYDERYLINCINYIHQNPVKAGIVSKCGDYQYCSYNDYMNNTGVANNAILDKIIGSTNYKILMNQENDLIFQDIDINKEQIIESFIRNFEKEQNKTIKEILKERKVAKKLIYILKYNYKITYKQIKNKFKISERELARIKC